MTNVAVRLETIEEGGITYYVRTSILNSQQDWYEDSDLKVRHRLLGPATIIPGFASAWVLHGKHHRDDGPAVEYVGDVAKNLIASSGYYIHGRCVSGREYTAWREDRELTPLEFTF